MKNLRYYFPGAILFMIALLIMVFPQILIAFIASLIIMAGIGALYLGHMIRKSEKHAGYFNNSMFEFEDVFFKRPFFGRWHN